MATNNPLPATLLEAVKYFSAPENCLSYLVASRWPDGVSCPSCGSKWVYFDKTRQGWICKGNHPRRKFSLKTGTIFEDSPIGLDKWLPAVWMIAGAKNGISSWELHRALGVTQKTAWFMLHRIRLAMQAKDGGKLGGEVEVDETFIGGKARNMHADKRSRRIKGRGPGTKAAVFGLLQRHSGSRASRVRTHVVKTTRRHELSTHIERHVEDGTRVYSDALPSYDHLGLYYQHSVIDHAECYANGEVHTNGIENFWSLLKRSINGTYVSVEPFHLFRYLDEQAFRFNEREGTDADRFHDAIKGIVGRRVMYQELIGESARAERP
jgi:transposase-like protein